MDAIKSGSASLDSIDEEALPAEMKDMNEKEKHDYVQTKIQEREQIKQEIAILSRERDDFVAEARAEAPAPAVPTIEEAVVTAVRAQGKQKNFEFEKE